MKASLKKVRTAFGVSEYRLSNGLRVLYRQERAAPVVSVCITFHVGSRNEAKGHTGATHILEHLLFKDSKNFNQQNGKAITGYLDWFGAYVNATTWLDRTNYFELLPSEKLEEALALEADRMRGSLFTDADLASEMTVVRNEFERSRNNPFELLDEEVMATAFTKHPYRIPTIGYKEDIEGSTAKKLREFYDRFYWPDNATLSILGNVPFAQVQKLVLKHFGPLPSAPHKIPVMRVKEPKQSKARKVALKRAMGVSIAALYYKICEGTHREYPAVLVAATILAGGFSSRLQKALVDTALAADLSIFAMPLKDPGVASFTAHVAEGIVPAQVLKVARQEIARFVKEGPSKQEVVRARERILSQMAMERDGVLSEARTLSESVAAGDWCLGYQLEQAVAKLTPKEVQRAAQKYFTPKGETAGTLLNAKK